MTDCSGTSGFFNRLPAAACLAALLAAVLHLAPHWRAQMQTPPGWTYTGNHNGSPDVMQYRIWMRQSQREGPIVTRSVTTEPHEPHVPVFFYYAIGQLSRTFNADPDIVFMYVGAILAAMVTLLTFATVRTFLPSGYQTWWVFIIIMFGGGLGAHLILLESFSWANDSFMLRHLLFDGLEEHPVFDRYRNAYVFCTLSSAHFLLVLLLMLSAILSQYRFVTTPSIARGVVSSILACILTIIHGHEAALLIMISGAVAVVCWRKRMHVRSAIVSFFITTTVVLLAMLWFGSLYKSSGFPDPPWRVNTLVTTLLIAYPIAWILILWGGAAYWNKAGLNECFLVGWALGLTALTLAGPFYPYTDRGTTTLQIVLYLIAGHIFFAHFKRVGPMAMALLVLTLAATPAFVVWSRWRETTFASEYSSVCAFSSPDHAKILSYLDEHATPKDILLVNKSKEDWRTDDLWLSPDFSGLLYCGHWFLTLDYDNKRNDIINFYATNEPNAQRTFLLDRGITFVYVAAEDNPDRFHPIPGLTRVVTTGLGSLYRYIQTTPTGATPSYAN